MPSSTTRWAIPYPLSSEPPDGPGAYRSLAEKVDTSIQPFSCTSTTRPTGVPPGFQVWETDTKTLGFWDGAAWRFISSPTYASWQKAMCYFRMYLGATLNVAVDGWTRVAFDTKSSDLANIAQIGGGSPGSITCPRAGMMQLAWTVGTGLSTGGAVYASVRSALYQGGAEIRGGTSINWNMQANWGFSSVGGGPVEVAAGQNLHVDVFFSCPGNGKFVGAGASGTYFEGYYVTP